MKPILNPKSYMYVGPKDSKKIHLVDFPKNVPIPVWDPKTERLIRALPYMREAVGVTLVPQVAAPAPAPEPEPSIDDRLAERDSLRAQLDAKSIGYDKRWNIESLRKALEAATGPVEMAAAQ